MNLVNKLSEYISNLEFFKDPAEAQKATQVIKEIPALMKSIKEMKEFIKIEEESNKNIRGSMQKSDFEDGF